jgi:hypothetical protein
MRSRYLGSIIVFVYILEMKASTNCFPEGTKGREKRKQKKAKRQSCLPSANE